MHKKKFRKKIGHHAKPKRATAPLRTGADMCRTGVGAGSSAGADKEVDHADESTWVFWNQRCTHACKASHSYCECCRFNIMD